MTHRRCRGHIGHTGGHLDHLDIHPPTCIWPADFVAIMRVYACQEGGWPVFWCWDYSLASMIAFNDQFMPRDPHHRELYQNRWGAAILTDYEAENSEPKCALLSAKCSRAQPMTAQANTRPLVTHYFSFKKVYKKSILINQ